MKKKANSCISMKGLPDARRVMAAVLLMQYFRNHHLLEREFDRNRKLKTSKGV